MCDQSVGAVTASCSGNCHSNLRIWLPIVIVNSTLALAAGTLSTEIVECDIADNDFEITFVEKATEVRDSSGPCSSTVLKREASSFARRYVHMHAVP